MNTKTKALILAVSAILLVVTTVFVTMAFLTSNDAVKNTFTVGDVSITLDETDVDGSKTDGDNGRDKANEYHLIPGGEYVKDPIVHVGEDSENCWIFVKVENGLKAIIAGTTIEAQMTANGWNCIDEANSIWAYNTVAEAEENIAVFEGFVLDSTIDGDTLAQYDGAKINVTAYAIQASGFATADAAWTAAGAQAQN